MTIGAQEYARDVAVASGGVYLTLRSLNAFLSTAQEVQVSGGAIFVNGSLQPLKVLEPVDDTVERIASLVFQVMVITGVLAVALGPASAVGFAMLAMAAMIALGLRQDRGPGRAAMLARRLGWYGAFLGLALPCSFLIAAMVADHMTQDVVAQHRAILDEITEQVAPELDSPGGGGALDWMRGISDDAQRYTALAGNIYGRADDLIASLVAITSVMIFKLLILPLLILGGFFVSARFFAGLDPIAARSDSAS